MVMCTMSVPGDQGGEKCNFLLEWETVISRRLRNQYPVADEDNLLKDLEVLLDDPGPVCEEMAQL